MAKFDIKTIALPMPGMLGTLNCYLIINGKRAALVDTGMSSAQNIVILKKKLAEFGHTPDSLDKVVCTHYHPDHCGMAKIFQDAGTRVFMSRVDAHALQSWFDNPMVDSKMASFFGEHYLPENFEETVTPVLSYLRTLVEPCQPEILEADGEVVDMAGVPFFVISSPGHTDGHVCLLHPATKDLIVGDHILKENTVNLAVGQASQYPSSLQMYLDSLTKISRLEVARGWAAHGAMLDDVAARCMILRQQYLEKVVKVRQALTESPQTAYDLSVIAFGEKRRPFSRWFNMGRTIASLEYLVATDAAICETDGENNLTYKCV